MRPPNGDARVIMSGCPSLQSSIRYRFMKNYVRLDGHFAWFLGLTNERNLFCNMMLLPWAAVRKKSIFPDIIRLAPSIYLSGERVVKRHRAGRLEPPIFRELTQVKKPNAIEPYLPTVGSTP